MKRSSALSFVPGQKRKGHSISLRFRGGNYFSLVLLLAFGAGCGDNNNSLCPDGAQMPDGAIDPLSLREVVNRYESGELTRDEYLSAIADYEDDGQSSLLSGTLCGARLLFARAEPYTVSADFVVDSESLLVIEQGAKVLIGEDVTVDIMGQFYAVAPEDNPIAITAPEGTFYKELLLHGGPNQIVSVDMSRALRTVHVAHPDSTHTLIENTEFDSWIDLAIAQNNSSGLHILDSRFGFNTPDEEVSGESIRTRSSGSIIIENSTFGYRTGYRDVIDLQDCDPLRWPVVIGNRFEGGEDDAIDLDNCSAYVIGNHIRNFRPINLNVQFGGVNGGGVTGDGEGSRPFIANNIIENCFHGIGFKNGAKPIIVHNTVINNNIGITLYQAEEGRAMPFGVVFNNILAGNVGWLDGLNNDIILNGKWWPTYNQVDDVQATIDAQFNITATLDSPYTGLGNLNTDPKFDENSELPTLLPDSPALNSGIEMLNFSGVDMGVALDYLSEDFLHQQRARSGNTFVMPDRGALEQQ